MVVVLLFGFAVYPSFPARVVVPWFVFAFSCNILRLVTRWEFLRQPISDEPSNRWNTAFVVVSAAAGLSWGMAASFFYTPRNRAIASWSASRSPT